VILGAVITAVTLYQIRETRIAEDSARTQDDADKKRLQKTIDDLNREVTSLSQNSIPALMGDVNGLKQPKTPPPDLRLRFTSPQEVAIVIDNVSHAGTADRPKYGVMLVDLDNIAADFLQIPTTMGEYIRPGSYWGPNQFMGISGVKSVVKPGDRIFGSVDISCPTCVKDRGYWLYIKAGEGGWYAEQEGGPFGLSNLKVIQQIAKNLDSYVNALVPESRRIPIK
jgi:hypothetical protein